MKHPNLHRMMLAEGLQNVNCSVLSLSLLGYRMTLVRSEGHPRLGGHWGMGT